MRHRYRCPVLLWLLIALHAVPGESGETITVRPRFDEKRHPGRLFFPHHDVTRPRIALVLTGGGARGAAQIGVLRVLERYNIPVDFIAATSMGAIIGGLYASGYTVDELDSLARRTDWDDVLSLTEDRKRSELFVDQKIAGDRSFLAVRFEDFTPVLPTAVSSGQRLTDFLNTQTLQALYHPFPDFDKLKIPFRAVATDLVSGKRVVLSEGPLAEALRASATVPLLFSPIEKDTMRLIDGGLVANIPVDVAREAGYDIVIVVNSTSGLRTIDEMNAPWQTADQIMGIMMKVLNERQLGGADIVITPPVGTHRSSDFRGLDTVIRAGESAAEQSIPAILSLYARKRGELSQLQDSSSAVFTPTAVLFEGGAMPDSLRRRLEEGNRWKPLTMRGVRRQIEDVYQTGDYRDVSAVMRTGTAGTSLTFTVTPNPLLTSVVFEGSRLVPAEDLEEVFAPLRGKPLNDGTAGDALERLLRLYRARGYSLARVDTVMFDERSGALRVRLNEGVIHVVDVQGGVRTRDSFVLREFPLVPGDVFQIDKARHGLSNINSTSLFEFVYLEVTYDADRPVLTIRLKERPSQLVRFGLRVDNERLLQGLLDVRDENFQGSGMELGMTAAGGERNFDALLEYRARRLFDSYLTFGVGGFFKVLDSYLYADASPTEPNHWSREQVGEYRDTRAGISLAFGSQLERLGNATVELLLQDVRIRSLDNAEELEGRYRLATIHLGTIVDTKDRFPFPTRGVGLNLSYEFAFEGLGSDISYNSLRIMYETYTTWGRHTFHPRLTMGFADKTMPFAQQFRLGGRESFFGVREDDRRGRELLLLNAEYRYFLPFRILFGSYLSVRYDLGTISAVPEELKFSTLRHGIGIELALDSPVGQAAFAVGKSFYFGKNLPANPVQQGPFLFYFMIGYQL